jgi:hypothetical protein
MTGKPRRGPCNSLVERFLQLERYVMIVCKPQTAIAASGGSSPWNAQFCGGLLA